MTFSSKILTELGSAVNRIEKTLPLGLKSVTGKKGIGISGLAEKIESQGIKLTDDIFSKSEKEVSAFFDDAVDQYYRRGQNELQSKIEGNLGRKLSDKELSVFRTSTGNQGILDKDFSTWIEKHDVSSVEDWSSYFQNKSAPISAESTQKELTGSIRASAKPINAPTAYTGNQVIATGKPEGINFKTQGSPYGGPSGNTSVHRGWQNTDSIIDAEVIPENKMPAIIKNNLPDIIDAEVVKEVPKPPINNDTPWAQPMKVALGTAVAGGALCAALSSSRGQQNNAQLYGQQPLY